MFCGNIEAFPTFGPLLDTMTVRYGSHVGYIDDTGDQNMKTRGILKRTTSAFIMKGETNEFKCWNFQRPGDYALLIGMSRMHIAYLAYLAMDTWRPRS